MSWSPGQPLQLELGQTTEATLLVKGRPDAITQNAVAIRSRGEAMAQAGDALKDIDSGAWVGDAGEAFREKFSYEPGRWHDAAEAFEAAAQALDNYSSVLRWAQDEAVEAIDLWEKAQQETDRAVAAHNASVDAANAQNQANAAAGNFNMVQVAPFSDPGDGGREAAREVLNHARLELALDLVRVVTVLQSRADEAPEQSMWADIGDAFGAAFDFVVDFGQGLWDVASGTAEFLWAISPHHLITDPEGYAKTWEALGQTMVSAFEDPIGFAKQMVGWEHWQNGEPGRALGNIVGNILSPTKAAGALGKAGRADVDTSSRAHDGPVGPRYLDDSNIDYTTPDGKAIPTRDLQHPAGDLVDPRLADVDRLDRGDLLPGRSKESPQVQNLTRDYKNMDPDPNTMGWPDSDKYPDGFSSPSDRRPAVLEPGTKIDRFGDPDGRFVSPKDVPYHERGLPPGNLDAGYHTYRVDKEIPVWAGTAAPAQGMPGGGTQYLSPYTIEQLIAGKYITEVG